MRGYVLSPAEALILAAKSEPVQSRFWSKVDRTGTCWLWNGGRMKSGYGRFAVHGQMILAHRAAYAIAFGATDDPVVAHHCDNPPCVNPAHLFNGTYSDNMQDMIRKGRQVVGDHRGEKHGRAKLTWAKAAEIRGRHESGESYRRLAASFGVAIPTIARIVKGSGWVKRA